jgi:hypothetical protein
MNGFPISISTARSILMVYRRPCGFSMGWARCDVRYVADIVDLRFQQAHAAPA